MSKSLNVVSLSPGDGKSSLIAALAHRWQGMGKTVQSGSAPAETEADIVLIEGTTGQSADPSVLIVAFSRDLDPGSVKSAAESLGDSLVGVIVNRVPTLGNRVAEQELKPALEAAGLRVLGLVPEDRALFGITVDDLVARLEGRYALEAEGRDLLVEHVMVGANLLDAEDFPAGPEYFGQRDKKAVIAKGDRPDFQWAAMNTPTRCLILTGDFEPIPYVLERAKELQVTIAVVEKDTLDTLDAIEEILSGPGLDGDAKLQQFTALVESSIDTAALDQALGVG